MDKPNVMTPSKEVKEQHGSSTTANPAPNHAFGGAVEQHAVTQLLHPYAAAAAVLAVANQQMAHQTNMAFRPQVNANLSSQTSHTASIDTQTNSSASTASVPANNVATQNVPQQGAVNPLQQLAFPFAPQNALTAALLGGGLLPGAMAAQAPMAAAALATAQQRNSLQQHLANSAVLTANTSAPVPKPAPAPATTTANAPPAQNVPRHSVAAAAAQVVAAHHASGAMANAVFANMQNWKLKQLEAHVKLLRDSSQPIPQQVALLLADARRKEEKRTAKRAANRRSACSSRARKKALVEEMTKANARLRRQAMILALLPDLVIAITVDGKITFCSAQVERVLRHQIPHLVGANFSDILTPPSRERIDELVKELLAAEQAATLGTALESPPAIAALNPKPGNAQIVQPPAQEVSSGVEGANQVSEGSFPLAEVNFANEPNSAEDNSDLSASNGGGKTDDGAEKRGASPEATQVKSDLSSGSGSNPRAQAQPSSDDSLSSSNDAKNLRAANEALGRNVRWHNEKLASEGKVSKKKMSHKDDVTGASVTANNAGARLSSLQVRSEPSADEEATRKRKASRYDSLEDQSSSSSSDLMLEAIVKKKSKRNGIENSSEDSGYRDSNQSEETFDDSSSLRNGPRPKPLAPACNICLIRDDLTTIWCEVTSSIRTRSLKDENSGEDVGPLEAKAAASSTTQSADASKSGEEDPASKGEVKELLLCLRPIRDGEETVDESLRFVAPKNVDLSDSTGLTDSGEGPSSSSTSVDMGGKVKRPPKKRPIVSEPSSSSLSNDSNEKLGKKPRLGEVGTEKSAVESLMLMGNNAK